MRTYIHTYVHICVYIYIYIHTYVQNVPYIKVCVNEINGSVMSLFIVAYLIFG